MAVATETANGAAAADTATAPAAATAPAEEPPAAASNADSAPSASAGVGLIYPPPEIRNIVDKTAGFVAKNGFEFAEKIRVQKEGDTKFHFLTASDPFHAYFLYTVESMQNGTFVATADVGEDGTSKAPAPAKAHAPSGGAGAAPDAAMGDTDASSAGMTGLMGMGEDEKQYLLVPPPDTEFCTDLPPVSVQDLDIIKLTAQFVATNGPTFLQQLSRREERNFQFDFLKPQHPLFTFFTKLVDQYSKVLLPKQDLKDKLKADANSVHNVWSRIQYSVDYTLHKADEHQKFIDERENEKMQYARINWHDFSIVETLEFTQSDAELPAPVTLESLSSRLIEQERYERQQRERAQAASTAAKSGDMDMDMDMDDDDDVTPATTAAKPTIGPAQPAKVTVRPYDPKSKKAASDVPAGDTYVISPITGERILASKLQEHMRIGLLDSKWREQKEKFEEEQQSMKDAHKLGDTTAMATLKNLASRRTDIFGTAGMETEIGMQARKSSALNQPQRLSEEETSIAARMAQANAAEQLRKQEAARQESEEKTRKLAEAAAAVARPTPAAPAPAPRSAPMSAPIGMPMPTSAPAPAHASDPAPMPAPARTGPSFQQPIGQMSNNAGPPPGRPPIGMAAIGGFMSGRPSVNLAPAVSAYPPASAPEAPARTMPEPEGGAAYPTPATLQAERPTKRAKTDALVAEDEFLQTHSGSVKFTVVVGESDEKFGLKEGQEVEVELDYLEKAGNIKGKIKGALGIPPGSQKLQIGALALNNTNTVAFYNITDDTTVTLSVKKRGGRK